MRVVLVDDEQLAVEMLEILLNRIGGVKVEAVYTNPHTLLEEIGNLEVEAVFLDMEMGTSHGLQVAKELKKNHPHIEIVFVTAHAQFAVGAFDVKAADYLLKPISQARLEESIMRLREKLGRPIQNEQRDTPETISLFAKMMGNFQLLDSKNGEVRWRTRKVKELFVYLWHHSPNPVHRSRIIEDLWGEQSEDRATTLMHTSLYQLRKTIRDIGFNNPVKLINEQYILNLQVDSDLSEVERMMQLPRMTHDEIEKVIGLYKGNYLEEDHYHWARSKQQQLKITFLAALENYVQEEMENEEPSHLVEVCLEKMIELDSYNERFVYLLVDYYGRTKNLKKVATVVETFKKVWVEELGIDIPDEIYNIYNEYMIGS